MTKLLNLIYMLIYIHDIIFKSDWLDYIFKSWWFVCKVWKSEQNFFIQKKNCKMLWFCLHKNIDTESCSSWLLGVHNDGAKSIPYLNSKIWFKLSTSRWLIFEIYIMSHIYTHTHTHIYIYIWNKKKKVEANYLLCWKLSFITK